MWWWRTEGLRTELVGDPPLCVLVEKKLTEEAYAELLEECQGIQLKRGCQQRASFLPDAEKPRTVTEKHLISFMRVTAGLRKNRRIIRDKPFRRRSEIRQGAEKRSQ